MERLPHHESERQDDEQESGEKAEEQTEEGTLIAI